MNRRSSAHTFLVLSVLLLCVGVAPSPAGAQPLAGSYDIGAAQPPPFNTVTAAVNHLNANGVSAPVIFRLTDATYPSETFPIVIHPIAGASAVNTITLKPAPGSNPTLEGSSTTAVLKLNGADYVTIDGSNNGTTSRDLTIRNTSTATQTACIWLSSLGAAAGCRNNRIINVNVSCGTDFTAAAVENFAIISSGTTFILDGEDNDGNEFVNNAITKCRFGIRLRGAAANLNDNNRVTDNLVGAAAFGPDQVSRGGIVILSQNAAEVSRNEVRFVGNRVSDIPGGADRVGIGIGADSWPSPSPTAITASTVTGNLIHDIVDEKTFAAAGIVVAGGGPPTLNTIANNMIYNVRANGTGGDQAVGIGIGAGNGDKVVFNSISMTGDLDPSGTTVAAISAAGIVVAAAPVNLTLLNNISAVNVTSNTGTLRHYSVVAPSAYNWGTGGSNNNDFWVDFLNPQMALGGIGTTTPYLNVLSIAAWRTQFAPAQDGASMVTRPAFLSATDLHLDENVPTRLESGGQQVIGVTTDFDGDSRGGISDIGADEGPFTAAPFSDVAAVAIREPVPGSGRAAGAGPAARALFENRGTSNRVNVPVVFEITGPSPSPAVVYSSAGNIPALNPDDPPFEVTFAAVNIAQTGTYTMTARLQFPDGDVSNDQVVGNFTVSGPLNGTYLVGAGEAAPFNTLTSALATLGGVGVSGNVTFELTDPVYSAPSETFPIVIPAYAGAGPGAGLTIRPVPSAGPVTIVGDGLSVLSLDGADYVTIDGSGNGTSSRDLTVQNTSSTAFVGGVVWGRTLAGNSATNNTIRNLRVIGHSNTTTLVGVGFGGTNPGDLGYLNHENTITNCEISRVQFGIVSLGASAAQKNLDTIISKNVIASPAPDNVSATGILVGYEDGIVITENLIGEISRTNGPAMGISLGLQTTPDLLNNVGFEVVDATVMRNRIIGISSPSAQAYSAVGIASAAVPTGRGLGIFNNMISGVTSPAGLGDLTAGIYVRTPVGSVLVSHNSVSMVGDRGAAVNPSFACALGGTGQLTLVLDNIFSNSQTATSTGKSYAIGLGTTGYATLNSNYNDLLTSGPAARFSVVGGLTNSPGGDRTTLADWRTTTGKDLNSISADPVFISPTNLHIATPTSPVSNAGTTGSGTNIDFDGTFRSNPPDIGADEFPAVWPAVTINDVAVKEGQYPYTDELTFTVTMAQTTSDTVWINYRTTTGTASPDTDYVAVPVPQRVGIPPGAIAGSIPITILGDYLVEPAEIFRVRLSDPIYAVLVDSIGFGTIVDDDNVSGVPLTPPAVTSLAPSFPNPFQRSTAISFGLADPGTVRVDLFDVQGRLVRSLLDEARPAGAGRVDWDGMDDRGRPAASGFYVVRMVVDGKAYTRSLRLVR